MVRDMKTMKSRLQNSISLATIRCWSKAAAVLALSVMVIANLGIIEVGNSSALSHLVESLE
jgi:hypothetical protein